MGNHNIQHVWSAQNLGGSATFIILHGTPLLCKPLIHKQLDHNNCKSIITWITHSLNYNYYGIIFLKSMNIYFGWEKNWLTHLSEREIFHLLVCVECPHKAPLQLISRLWEWQKKGTNAVEWESHWGLLITTST